MLRLAGRQWRWKDVDVQDAHWRRDDNLRQRLPRWLQRQNQHQSGTIANRDVSERLSQCIGGSRARVKQYNCTEAEFVQIKGHKRGMLWLSLE